MKNEFIYEWVKLIRHLFPPDASIEIDEADDVVLRIDWKLGNDPERPNKRSRLIRVIISIEAIEDCRDYKLSGDKFYEIIKGRIAFFNPDHDQPRWTRVPIEDWVISTADIN